MVKKKRIWIWIFPGLLILCLMAAGISAVINLSLPTASPVVENLSPLDKARLEEFSHLKADLGEQVFPGFGDAGLGQIVYNEEYAFLVNLRNPAKGWLTLPTEKKQGVVWQPVENDLWNGETYYRQPLQNGITPQAFAVRIGESYAGSMTTLDWTRISMINQFRQDLPSFLRPIFPYQLAVNLFIRGSDMYISLLIHESFHAYQADWSGERFYTAEASRDLYEGNYPWNDLALQEAWLVELETLQAALRNEDPSAYLSLAAQFLNQRAERRAAIDLPENLIQFENNREWVEGLARYAELESWRLAGSIPGYYPVESIRQDPGFRAYEGFEQRWKQELDQITRMAADPGDGRFYYSGMAQAYLLDRLLPDWKERLIENPALNLEDLLKIAVAE